MKNVWEAASTIYDKSKNLNLPWLKFHEKTIAKKKSKYAGLKEAWTSAFGDLDDPVIKAQIDATSRWLLDSAGDNN